MTRSNGWAVAHANGAAGERRWPRTLAGAPALVRALALALVLVLALVLARVRVPMLVQMLGLVLILPQRLMPAMALVLVPATVLVLLLLLVLALGPAPLPEPAQAAGLTLTPTLVPALQPLLEQAATLHSSGLASSGGNAQAQALELVPVRTLVQELLLVLTLAWATVLRRARGLAIMPAAAPTQATVTLPRAGRVARWQPTQPPGQARR